MNVIAIDPGNEKSALVIWDGVRVAHKRYEQNDDILHLLRHWNSATPCVIEMIGHYGTGMPAGQTVFDTCVWIGRFMQAYSWDRCTLMKRGEVKMHLCGNMRAKDPHVRQAILDRFGGKEKAIGKKAAPGPLYGVSGDEWSALAVGITWWDRENAKAPRGKERAG